MIINNFELLKYAPIKNMEKDKLRHRGTSYGLSEAGYDIRIKQDIFFQRGASGNIYHGDILGPVTMDSKWGRFCLASAIEEFDMPVDLVGVVHDKSTWARQGLSVFNTVIEPGWKGFLTLELVYHGEADLHIPAGSGIAQVLFHQLHSPSIYEGKYQDQQDQPVQAILD